MTEQLNRTELMSKNIMLMFSSSIVCVCVCGLTFRTLSYYEFVFVYGLREYFNLIFLHVTVPFYQQHFLKKLYFIISFVFN